MTNPIRKFMKLVEGAADPFVRDDKGRVEHDDIKYEEQSTAVIASLRSYNSQVYSKLGERFEKIKKLEKEIKAEKDAMAAETKAHVADLFAVEDQVKTRIINTVSFTFELSKVPKPTETFKYAAIVEELEQHLTPELITVLESLKEKYKSTVNKSPSLTVTKTKITEGFWDVAKSLFEKFKDIITRWVGTYDAKLDDLKEQFDSLQDQETPVTEGMEPMAFSKGTVVYSGSKSGTVVGPVENNPENVIIELPNGERDVVPLKSLTTEKPSFLKRAASKLVGEGEEQVNEYCDSVEDCYPVAATLTDDELEQYLSQWKLSSPTTDASTDSGKAFMDFGAELQAEKAKRQAPDVQSF